MLGLALFIPGDVKVKLKLELGVSPVPAAVPPIVLPETPLLGVPNSFEVPRNGDVNGTGVR